MKVAICFYGQPRKYKKVLEQWQLIINEINADVFIHTWYGQDRGKSKIDINELISDFNPKEILVSNPHKFIKLIPEEATYENQSYHAMQQSYSITKSFEICDKYSKEFNIKYDVIVKCRMDINLKNLFSFIDLLQSNVKTNDLFVASNHWKNHLEFDDNIMVGKFDIMNNVYSNFYQYTIDVINKTKIIPGGEQNIFRYICARNFINNIKKIEPLDFDLLVYEKNEEIILNQNKI